ncbi:universal stress protein [Pseudofrankia sp. BMG5.36]|uniref:universal stress protein n=1 Tax=Pseudofrankia sp. BMG5.36 TaxID=1834512 RepID=UPI000ADD39CE|nr:universal stress protein [Pseudofrankia sp. BMG5.36]
MVSYDEKMSGNQLLDRATGRTSEALSTVSGTRIVVGVDGSLASAAALRWAATEARRRGAQLSVVVAYRHDITLQPPVGSDAWHAATQALDRALRAAGVDPESVEAHLVDGSPATCLAAVAHRADLLVIGHQEHGPLSRTLLGALNTDREPAFRCPVVVVPPGCEPQAE